MNQNDLSEKIFKNRFEKSVLVNNLGQRKNYTLCKKRKQLLNIEF